MKTGTYVPKKTCIITLYVLFFCMSVSAQESVSIQNRNQVARYYLGSDDELLIPVNIWGFVQRPGQYMIPNNTDLISLLSYAGGPTPDAKMSNIKIVRGDPRFKHRILRVNVQRYLDTADDRLNYILKPGDTVIVKGTTYQWLRKFFDFISRLAIFANIYYLIVIAESRN